MYGRLRRRSPRSSSGQRVPLRRRWPWAILLIVSAALAAASVGDHGLVRLFKLRAGYDKLLERNGELEADNARLEVEVRRLREESYAIEKIAREELGMARPDEIVFQVAH
jgi:cell division protein FtsB